MTTDETKSLLIKRPVNLKVVVTERWKEEVQTQLQGQINKLDGQLQQLEAQGQKAIAEVQKLNPNPLDPNVQQQVRNVQNQMGQQRNKLVEQKNQALQQIQQLQTLELEQEVLQAQLESFVRVEIGDNLVAKMNGVEILMRDGIIEELRGDV